MSGSAPDRWRVPPGSTLDLRAIDPATTDGAPGGRKETEATFGEFHDRLLGLQERLWAERRQSLLVVLQAMDAGGKDGTVKHLYRGFNPVGARVVSFRVPSEEELAHDFLWRVHKQAPALGEVVLFNRSHYEDVLVVRVRSFVPEDVWRPRFGLINAFETHLAAAGTTVIKLFLHISLEEQLARFRARLEDPTKRWKFRKGDLDERALWDAYMVAYTEALERTSTEAAPWHVVPADRKWYRNWAIGEIVTAALEAMNPRYPPGDDLEGVVLQ